MSDLHKTVKNALLSFGGTVKDPAWNVPAQYSSRENQYYMAETDRFKKRYLKYGSDFFKGEALGFYGPDEDEWVSCKFRLAEVVRPSSAIQREFDDYKHLMLEEPALPYIPQGTKFRAMGAVWLMINPLDISNGDGGGIVRRCRVTWNHLDYYGNVLQEPFVVETDRASANSDDSQQWDNITKGYFNITCAANRWTKQLGTNSRMIFGSGAYRITGFTDFFEEFTGDFDSTRVIRFTARYEEPNDEIDDMVNRVAEGLTFTWEIELSGAPTMTVGGTGAIAPTSRRKGQIVENSEEYPITYLWESSDESVVSVDEAGNVTANAEGTATITCKLAQNPDITATYEVTVAGAQSGGQVVFLQDVPAQLRMYQSVTLEAEYMENGEITGVPVEYAVSGASPGAYTAEIEENSVKITCWGGSTTPLTVTASYGEYSTSAEIYLKGI